MGGMDAAVIMARRVMLVLKHGHSGAGGLSEVERSTVSAEHFYGRPFRKNRDGRRGVRAEFLAGVDDVSTDHSEHRLNALNLLLRDSEIVLCEHGEVGEVS